MDTEPRVVQRCIEGIEGDVSAQETPAHLSKGMSMEPLNDVCNEL